jgi:two-component system cell cycle sensor histidine kinase/response regulator CckA
MVPEKKRRSRPSGNACRPKSTKDRYRAIVENAPEVMALIGGDGTIVYVNPQLEKVLGHLSEEVEGKNIFEFVNPEDLPRATQEYSQTIQQLGEGVPSVLRICDTRGDWIPFEIVANNRLEDPALKTVIFTARDLRYRKDIEDAIHRANSDIEKRVEERTTELAKTNAALRLENQARRQAEGELQNTVSLLNATLDSTADGILVISNDGQISSCNQKFAEMWKVCRSATATSDDQQLLSEVLDQLLNPKDFLDRVQKLYSDRSATSFDVLYFRDGRIFERYSQPQRLGNRIVGRVWSFRDVTKSKGLELELSQSRKMEALGRLAGGIAHDFNNLLMLISGYVNQLLQNPNLTEAHATCEQVLGITNRAASVTRQLLAFGRKQPSAPTVTDLNTIVLNMEPLLRRLLSDQVRLTVSVSSETQPIYADISQIEVLIINLAINAQDAMPEGGVLSISTNSHSSEENGETNTFAVLEVSDTGHGMTPDISAHIFEPFFTTKELGRGTGLGLSTAFGTVERAGGHFEVETAPNRGSTFRVYLPHSVAAAVTPTPSVAPPARGNETILLAEDEDGIREMTRAYLESLGYAVLEAASGSDAIRISLEYNGTIQLLVTDILMPGIRGDSAATIIQKTRPNVKIIFISGYTDQVVTSATGNILHKPFEFPELGRRVRSILDSDLLAAARTDSAAD